MIKTGTAPSVLLGLAVLSGCGADPGEPSFPRPTATPKPAPEYLIPEKPQGPRPGGRFEPMRPGGEVTEPVEITRVEPDCRLLEGAEQPIVVDLIVTKEGAVEGARLLSQVPAAAKAAVLQSVRGWRFRPSTFNGRPVPVYFTVALRRCP
jgi:hypothetical protein